MEPTSTPLSPLLRLPGELRNKIYEYVFSDQTICPSEDWLCGTIKLSCKSTTATWFEDTFEVFTALTKTCRQIHEETRLLPFEYCYYEVYKFTFRHWLDRMDREMREIVWLRLTEGQRAHLLEAGPWETWP